MRRMLQGRAGMGLAFLLGLLIATAGTATAAKLITGKQIKDGTITQKDLAKALRKQLAKTGTPGAIGPQGPAGANGAPGARGDKGLPGSVISSGLRKLTTTPGSSVDLLSVGPITWSARCVDLGGAFSVQVSVASTQTDVFVLLPGSIQLPLSATPTEMLDSRVTFGMSYLNSKQFLVTSTGGTLQTAGVTTGVHRPGGDCVAEIDVTPVTQP